MRNILKHFYPFATSLVAASVAGVLLVAYSLAIKQGLNALDSRNALVIIAAVTYSGLIGLVAGIVSDLVRLWVFTRSTALWTYVTSTVLAFVATLACLVSMSNLQFEQSITPIALIVAASTIIWSVTHFKTFASSNQN